MILSPTEESMLITQTLPIYWDRSNLGDQVLTLTNTTWEDYKKLDSPEYNHYLCSYLDNEITIMSPGRNHERISELIGILINSYCLEFDIPYYPFGSTRLQKEGLEGKEPDKAYAFNTDKDTPDLAVEINFTSGSIKDLTKYNYLKVKEVWIWQNQELRFYHLSDDNYKQIEISIHLDKIQASELITYVNLGLTEDFLTIQRNFLKEINN